MRWYRLLLTLAVAVGFSFWSATPVSAHEAGTTAVEITASDVGLDVQIDMPLDELGEALDQSLPNDVFGLSQVREGIVTYLLDNVSVAEAATDSDTGAAWPLTVGRITVVQIDGLEILRAPISAEGSIDEAFTFTDQAIVEHDDSHQIIVTAIGADNGAHVAGILDSGDDDLTLSLTSDGAIDTPTESAFAATVLQGFDHVLDGADHILFLLTLLLPAVLVADGRRWQTSTEWWPAAKKVVHVATAFTIGHSISLAGSALGLISLPTRPIEILIAVSVGVSAVHAIRPLATRGELPIAAGFGLIHGLAFAEILANLELSGSSAISTLLAFNIGIELAQLLTIAVAFPSLWLLSRTRSYASLRVVAGGLALVASAAWTLERLGLGSNPFGAIESGLVNHLPMAGAAALGVAVMAWLVEGRLRPQHVSGVTSCRATGVLPGRSYNWTSRTEGSGL